MIWPSFGVMIFIFGENFAVFRGFWEYVNGTLNLLSACVDFGVERFVYASSCVVYGNIREYFNDL